MKILEPWGHQRLSFLLEKAASREAEIWRIYVPKKPSSQVRISLLLLLFVKYIPTLVHASEQLLHDWSSDFIPVN